MLRFDEVTSAVQFLLMLDKFFSSNALYRCFNKPNHSSNILNTVSCITIGRLHDQWLPNDLFLYFFKRKIQTFYDANSLDRRKESIIRRLRLGTTGLYCDLLKGWYSSGTEFEIISKPHVIYIFIGDKACTSNFEIRLTTFVSLSITLEAKMGLNTI